MPDVRAWTFSSISAGKGRFVWRIFHCAWRKLGRWSVHKISSQTLPIWMPCRHLTHRLRGKETLPSTSGSCASASGDRVQIWVCRHKPASEEKKNQCSLLPWVGLQIKSPCFSFYWKHECEPFFFANNTVCFYIYIDAAVEFVTAVRHDFGQDSARYLVSSRLFHWGSIEAAVGYYVKLKSSACVTQPCCCSLWGFIYFSHINPVPCLDIPGYTGSRRLSHKTSPASHTGKDLHVHDTQGTVSHFVLWNQRIWGHWERLESISQIWGVSGPWSLTAELLSLQTCLLAVGQ